MAELEGGSGSVAQFTVNQEILHVMSVAVYTLNYNATLIPTRGAN